MLRKVAICALMATTLLVAGCGGSDDSTSAEDTKEIEELVDRLNQAAREKDASEFCLIMQPSAVEETFHGIDQCVKETRLILKAAGQQPELKVESVEVDGDVASVEFEGSAGSEARFIREGGQWYLPLGDGASGSAATGADGSEG